MERTEDRDSENNIEGSPAKSIDIEERMLKAIRFLFSFSPGSLWLVNDELWNICIENFVKKRRNHPALCLGKTRGYLFEDSTPMLIGTSHKSHRAIVVSDVFHESPKGPLTYFRLDIKPVPIPISYAAGAADAQWIKEAPNKKRLTPLEMERMKSLLKARGIW